MSYFKNIFPLHFLIFCWVSAPVFSLTCQQTCITTNQNSCEICAQVCQNRLLYNSCKQNVCSKESNSECIEYTQRYLPQSDCTLTCCDSTESKFTRDTLSQCMRIDTQQIHNNDTNIILAFCGVIAIIVFIVVPVIFLCWLKNIFCFNKINIDQSQLCLKQINTNQSKAELYPQCVWNPSIKTNNNAFRQTTCSICLQFYINCKTYCGHNFHFSCIKQWIIKKQCCPNCISQKFNPLTLTCDKCHCKSLKFKLTLQNTNRNHPFVDKNQKIICDQCMDSGRAQILEVEQTNKNKMKKDSLY